MHYLTRLLGCCKSRTERKHHEPGTAKQLVEGYLYFLESWGPLPGRVADTKQLPYSKDAIKATLSARLMITQDPRCSERLRQSYLMLSAWQEGVGDEAIGLNFEQLDLTVAPEELSEIIQIISASMEKWTPLIDAEREALLEELKTMGAYRKKCLI